MQQKFNWPSFADLVLIGQPQIHKGDLWGGDNGSIFFAGQLAPICRQTNSVKVLELS